MTLRTTSSSKYLLEIPTEVKFLSHSKMTKQCLINRRRKILRLDFITGDIKTKKTPWGSESNVMKMA